MTLSDYDNAIKTIAEHYGFETQSRQLFEEMGELIVAMNKWWRCTGNIEECASKRANVIEEIADVTIMLYQMVYMTCSAKEVDKIIQEKVERQLKRMESEEQ